MNTVGRKTEERRARERGAEERADAELIRRCLAKERAAEEEFYRTYSRMVAANLFRVLGDRQDLDDLVQEVFVIAFRGLRTFRQEARLSTWLYRICVNVALGRIRTKTRRPPPILKADPTANDTRVSPAHPGKLLESAQAKEFVYALLAKLSPKKRIVLFLHEIEGHDLKEIAYLVDANPVTVRTRLYYARKEFYRLLEEAEEGR